MPNALALAVKHYSVARNAADRKKDNRADIALVRLFLQRAAGPARGHIRKSAIDKLDRQGGANAAVIHLTEAERLIDTGREGRPELRRATAEIKRAGGYQSKEVHAVKITKGKVEKLFWDDAIVMVRRSFAIAGMKTRAKRDNVDITNIWYWIERAKEAITDREISDNEVFQDADITLDELHNVHRKRTRPEHPIDTKAPTNGKHPLTSKEKIAALN